MKEWEDLTLENVSNCPYGSMEAREEAFWRTHIADYAGSRATPVKDIAYFEVWLNGEKWDMDDPDWNVGYWQNLIDVSMFQTVKQRMNFQFHKAARATGNRDSFWAPLVHRKYEKCMRRISLACAHRAMFVTKKGYNSPGIVSGRITPEILAKYAPDYLERQFYISGPNSMVDSTKEFLLDLHVPHKNIKTDHFSGY